MCEIRMSHPDKIFRVIVRTIILGACIGGNLLAWAQPATKITESGLPPGTLLSIGGSPISEKTVNGLLADLQSQGKTITAQMRDQVIASLVVKRVLLDEAKLQKLDLSKPYTEKLEEISQNLMIEFILSDYLAKHPLTVAVEKAEYARQRSVLGDGPTTPQYQLRQVLLKTDQEARSVIARALKGENFDKLAEETIDVNSKSNGGMTGWVLPSEILPAVSSVIVNLSKGVVTTAPIQTPAGWLVLKVEDVRDHKIPSFEEARVRVRQNLLVQRQQAYIESLVKKADIKRP